MGLVSKGDWEEGEDKISTQAEKIKNFLGF